MKKEFLEKLKQLGFKEENLDFNNIRFKEFLFNAYISDQVSIDELYLNLNIDYNDFLRSLAYFYNLDFFEWQEFDDELKVPLPYEILLNYQILPFKMDDKYIYIASFKPCSLEILEKIQRFFKDKFVKNILVNHIELKAKLQKFKVLARLQELSLKLKEELANNLKKDDKSSINQIFDFLIHESIKFCASDIHIEAREKDALIRFRIDGMLNFFCILDKEIYQALVFYIKFLANLNVAEFRKAQDGNFEFKIDKEHYDFRISTLPLMYGESVVIRILKHDLNLLNLNKLDFNEKDLSLLRKNIHFPHGMILLTGPTGSGKSTTLYACLNEIKSIQKKIITVEDPIEYKMSLVQQILLNSKAGLDFNNALRSILRQDPDVIMIGEIRDEQSLDIAIKSALTGHLILSTLHTNNAISTLTRLIDMNVKPYLLASSLNLIIAQRLLRKLCPYCKKQSYKKYKEFDGVFYESKGCEFCNYSGFFGRQIIVEVLDINDDIKELIRTHKGEKQILEYAKNHGFKNMFENALEKAKEGFISLDEIVRVLG